MIEDTIKLIESYRPVNDQEERDRVLILEHLHGGEIVFTREDRLAHMTASAWVTNPARDRVLMIYHNIYNSWSWTGGHADGDTDLLAVALREVREETGVTLVRPLSREIFSLESLTVDGHIKRGHYVSSHLHLNLTFLLEADDTEPLRGKPDENSAAAWFGLDEAVAASCEPWFREHIYQKLNTKLRALSHEAIHCE